MAVAWCEGQGRQSLGRRHGARSGGAHHHAAALPAHGRSRHAACSTSTMSKVPAGDYRIAIKHRRPLAVGQGDADGRRLRGKQRTGRQRCRSARPAVGTGNVAVDGDRTERLCDASAATRSPPSPRRRCITRRTVRRSPRNESITHLERPVRRSRAGHRRRRGSRSAPPTALDVAALLKALDRYPFGCTEQTTSRALPLLYVNELAGESQLALDTRHRSAHPRCDRAAAVAAGARTARSACGRSAATIRGSMPM